MIPVQQAMAFSEAVDIVNREMLERIAKTLAAEVRRLREENERQRFDILAMNQSLDLMREENERLRKDAERYRFLRELAKSNNGITRAQAFFWNCGGSRKQLDKAIDAARGEK